MMRSLPLLLLLAACGPRYSPNTYAEGAVQQASKVEQGVVVGVRRVAVQAGGAAGAAAGGLAGGVVGSQAGGGGVGTALTALGGSLVGGLVGSGIERVTGDTTALEYVVRKPNGELVSVTQRDEVALVVGQAVLVIAGSQARIVPDYTVVPATALVEPVKVEMLPGVTGSGTVGSGTEGPAAVGPGAVGPAAVGPGAVGPAP